MITKPTCFKKPEGTLVDPVIVRNKHRFIHHINTTCDYSDHHNMVGLVTKCHVPHQKPTKITYRNLKNFDEEAYVNDIQMIPFHICSIFDDVDDQCWARKQLFTNVLNEHAPLKERTLREKQVPYMHSQLRKEMYKRNMLRNRYKKDPSNDHKWNQFRIQRNLVTSFKRTAIKDYILSKCKPGAPQKISGML